MSKSKMTRRVVVAGAASVPALTASAALATVPTGVPDPIYAAIERSRKAEALFYELEDGDDRFDAAGVEAREACEAFASTVATTPAGLAALTSWVREAQARKHGGFPYMDEADFEAFTKSLDQAVCGMTGLKPWEGVPTVEAEGGKKSDAEILVLGAELEGIIGEWHAKSARDAVLSAAIKAAIEAAGLPDHNRGDFSSYDEWNAYRAKYKAAYAHIVDDDVDEDGGDVVWSDIHERLHPLCEDILGYRPRTVAGLGVLARAMSISVEDISPDEMDGVRAFVEAVCVFSGVVPVTSDHVGQPGGKAVVS